MVDANGGEELAASSRASTYLPQLLSHSGHVASVFGFLKLPVRLHGGERERLPMGDGGSLVLHWWSVTRMPVRATQPIILIVHGINNSSDTPYLQYLMRHLEELGYMAVTVNMRGHGADNHITGGRFYTARADDDLRRVCEHIRRTRAPPALYAVGFSMGANQLLCFLARGGGDHVDAAVSISCPFDLTQLKLHFRTGITRLYGLMLALPLKRLLWHARHHLPLTPAQFWGGMRALSVEAFDASVQVPLLGLRDVDEYYQSHSCLPLLPHLAAVAVPLLVVHALDDPLIPPHVFAAARATLRRNPHASLVVTERGGHIGWLTGRAPWATYAWSDLLVAKFLERVARRGGRATLAGPAKPAAPAAPLAPPSLQSRL